MISQENVGIKEKCKIFFLNVRILLQQENINLH